MLERILIKNFQVHEKIIVDFDPLITVFVGGNDRGKSAILRALRWVFLNYPSGEAFIRDGASSVNVSTRVDGQRIGRGRGDQGNYYGLEEKKYVSFGTKVPEPIKALLNVSEVNFQDQLDAAFWFSLSPSEVSRELNSIVNLEQIDYSLYEASKLVRRCKTELEISEERLKENQKEYHRLDWVKEATSELTIIEELDIQVNEERGTIYEAWKRIDKIEEFVRETEVGESLFSDWDQLCRVFEETSGLQKRKENLSAKILLIEQLEVELCDLGKILSTAEEKLRKDLNGKCPLCGTKTIDVF